MAVTAAPTIGACWLWCQRSDVPVWWLGPVRCEGQHAPLYACAPCTRRLDVKRLAHLIRGGTRTSTSRGWVTGECWLWCEGIALPVMTIGEVGREGQPAPLLACERCIRDMESAVQALLLQRARRPPQPPQPPAHRMAQ